MPSWGDMEAVGMLIPMSQSTAVSAGMCSRSLSPGRDKRHQLSCAPHMRDLAKPQPGQLVWKGWRSRAGYFSFFLGTDWFKFVSQ